jgi:ribosome-binding protein aMBF1 (putative translation factor)
MGRRERTDALAFLDEMRANDPELQAEYERLGPRYELISALIGARQRAGLNQGELARRMGRSQAVVSRLESAEHSPRFETLIEYAEACGHRIEFRIVEAEESATA